jgi:hypothetical protein
MHTIPDPPDSALATVAEKMLNACAPPPLVNHSHRSYCFATVILERRGQRADAEALFVASALHDLALTDIWDDGVTPFERRGAAVAFDALIATGAREELATLVRDAIAVHLEVSSADDARPEVAGLHLGAALDALGSGADQLGPDALAAVIERYPRDGFKRYITGAIRSEAARKPTSRMADYVELGVLAIVEAAPFDD